MPDAKEQWLTPWRYKDEGGLYIGVNREMWLYRSLPLSPMTWEDKAVQISLGESVASLLNEIGSLSKAPVSGVKTLGRNREVHLLSVRWEDSPGVPPSTPISLRSFHADLLSYPVTRRMLVLGVRLWASDQSSEDRTEVSLRQQLLGIATRVLMEDVPDRSRYEKDRQLIEGMFARAGATVMSQEEQRRLESWFADGKGPETTIIEERSALRMPDHDDIQMSAVMRFGTTIASAPDFQWAMEATGDPKGPSVVSVRAELEPSASTRARARNSQRKIMAVIDEEEATGDLDRPEFSEAFQKAQQFEEYLTSAKEPIMTRCSIIMGTRISSGMLDFYDRLREGSGIEIKALEHRQIPALDETLPCSSKRINPFLQDVSISMVAHAGMNGFSQIGDSSGLYVGASNPDTVPVFLEVSGAAKANLPAATLIAGDSGSGKTFLAQLLAVQATLAGDNVMFINPKGYDSLAPMARYVDGEVVQMSALQDRPGSFDPFRYAPPELAAEIASNHIISVLAGPGGFSQEQQLQLGSAMKRAAQVGVRCVGEAFPFITDGSIIAQIRQQMDASSLFALGIALEPLPQMSGRKGMTLVEFDRALDLPDPAAPTSSYTRRELIALAAIRLVTRAAMETLSSSGGGMLVLDEAWTFLGYSEGLSALQRLGREGRSLGILPVFATQRVADVLSKDMESYLSRVFAMKLTDERDANLALELCGLEPTAARVRWLSDCGPKRNEGGGFSAASALHRDLKNRHCAVSIWPVSSDLYQAITTNPEERTAREDEA